LYNVEDLLDFTLAIRTCQQTHNMTNYKTENLVQLVQAQINKHKNSHGSAVNVKNTQLVH